MTVAVVCEHCGATLPPSSKKGGPKRKYCPDTNCRVLAYQKREREKKHAANPPKFDNPLNQTRTTRHTSRDGRSSVRRGPMYEAFRQTGPEWSDKTWLELLEKHQVTVGEVVEATDESQANVSRWYAAHLEDRVTTAKRQNWTVPAEAQRALTDFRFFRERYFKVARGKYKGKAPVTTDFHLKWINAILAALPAESGGTGGDEGGQLAILSPPRHGKSLLMAHFTIWLIVRNPDIAIIWAGGNENIAKRFGGLVARELEANELLREEFCGPGGTFKPERQSGKQWRSDELEVATRTIPQPAPTLKCVGRGGTILSMDADLIVTDDLDSNKTIRQPAQREQAWEWFNTDLASRKEEHTAWIVIGSRQHEEDLAGKLLESEEWECIVETAHSHDCAVPADEYDRHTDCVLWPEVRTYRYLAQKRRQVGNRIFNMQYLNNPDGLGSTVFSKDNVEACFNHSRRIGDRAGVPARCRLIAGIDPAAAGYQAAVLWAVDVDGNKLYLLDAENEKAGAITHLVSIMRRWKQDYNLSEWVFEDNSNNKAWLTAREVIELRQELGIVIHQHTTGNNKHDNVYGVTAMAAWFEDQPGVGRRVDLPYGDDKSRLMVDTMAHQLRNYSTEHTSRQSSWKTDLVMAGWFPFLRIRRWFMDQLGQSQTPYMRPGSGAFDTQYTAEAFKIDYAA